MADRTVMFVLAKYESGNLWCWCTKRLPFFYACLIIAGCSCIASCTGQNPNMAMSVGSVPPDIKAVALDGSAVSLLEYRGKVVLVNFWASWCGPCVSELPALERLYQKLKPRGFVVLAVGIDDTRDNLAQSVKALGLTFPVAVDTGDAKSDYKLTGVPETFLLDAQGKIMLMMDPDTGQASSRILGPRDWDEPKMVSRIASLLSQ